MGKNAKTDLVKEKGIFVSFFSPRVFLSFFASFGRTKTRFSLVASTASVGRTQ